MEYETDEDGYSYTNTGGDVSGGEIVTSYKLRATSGCAIMPHGTCSSWLIIRLLIFISHSASSASAASASLRSLPALPE